MPAPFRAELIWLSEGVGLVDVAGEIDLYTAEELTQVLTAAREAEPERLLVDLSAVEFIDSLGLSALVRSARPILDAGASFSIVCPDPRLLQVFDIAGLTEVLTFYATREGAAAG